MLSQRPIAGVGNIYADEALWRARVHPARRRVTRRAERLLGALRAVLAQGIDNGGTTLRDYRSFTGETAAISTHSTATAVTDSRAVVAAPRWFAVSTTAAGPRSARFVSACNVPARARAALRAMRASGPKRHQGGRVDDAAKAEFFNRLRSPVGATGTPNRARDAVNQAMIRHWCDAMEDANPNYTDPVAAAAGPHGQIVAPPTMLNAWTMIGNVPRPLDPNDPQGTVGHLLDSAGYVGVVATNCEHVYTRYPRLGDHLTGTLKLVDVSEEKQTGLGIGHFVTTETEYHDQNGEHVGSMFFRILKFKPGTGRAPSGPAAAGERPRRPRPGMNQDTAFFWEGLRAGELRIQRCNNCGALEHPPTVRCLTCGSTDRGYVVASGRAHLYSYVVAHHPQVPSFDYPLNIGLVELEEGIRLVTNIVVVHRRSTRGRHAARAVLPATVTTTSRCISSVRHGPARRTTTLTFDEVTSATSCRCVRYRSRRR